MLVWNDRQQCDVGIIQTSRIAMTVLSRVLSHYPDRNSILIDAGALALSRDQARRGGFGEIVGRPDLKVFKVFDF